MQGTYINTIAKYIKDGQRDSMADLKARYKNETISKKYLITKIHEKNTWNNFQIIKIIRNWDEENERKTLLQYDT